MKGGFLRVFVLAAVLAATGCASVRLDVPPATPATVERLRSAALTPMQVGAFRLAPGRDAAMDTSLSGLRGSTLVPSKGSWSQFLRDSLVAELSAAGLLDPQSRSMIEGHLTDSRVDAAIGTGTGRLAARFTVTRDGRPVYDKELAVDARWDSSFVGAVAIPAAMNQYSAMHKSLVAKLLDDPEFRRALAK